MGSKYDDFSFNILLQLIKNKFYMSSHSHKRVEPSSKKSNQFTSKHSSQSHNTLGSLIQEDKNYE